jgi:hypothetical protein
MNSRLIQILNSYLHDLNEIHGLQNGISPTNIVVKIIVMYVDIILLTIY